MIRIGISPGIMKVTVTVVMMLTGVAFVNAREPISDMQAAREWCDRTPLHHVEGIWQYPEDETSVLVARSMTEPGCYDIVVVETPDTRLSHGETIGYLKSSADNNKFEMGLYTSRRKGVLSELDKCLATLANDDNSIYFKGRRFKLSIASRKLLPSFWKMIRVTFSDPLEALPKGMVRIYPENSLRQPDYL